MVDKLRVVHPTKAHHRVRWKTAKRFPPWIFGLLAGAFGGGNHGGQAARCPPYKSPSPRRVDGHPVENREAFSTVDLRATRWSIRWWEPWWTSFALSTLRKPITA